jgi:hypothetical protein
MTVKQLIEHLQTLPQDKKVMISHTDHSDWTYYSDLGTELIDEDGEYWDEENSSDELDYEDEVEKVVMINCRFWN